VDVVPTETEAKKGRVMEQLRETLTSLVHAITGGRYPELREHYLDKLIEGEEYYLPDGGYSRIVVSLITGRAFLTSNSLQTAKENLRRYPLLIADLEQAVLRARIALDPEYRSDEVTLVARPCEWLKDTICPATCRGPAYCPHGDKI
jgi:hypothetical protein